MTCAITRPFINPAHRRRHIRHMSVRLHPSHVPRQGLRNRDTSEFEISFFTKFMGAAARFKDCAVGAPRAKC